MHEDVARARKDARILFVEGERWIVYEVVSAYDRRGASLVFESENVVRRVRDYPANWRELPNAELLLMMERS